MLQPYPTLLLAEIGEVLGAIITLGAIIFWVIQKIAEANKAVQKRPARPVAAPPAAVPAGARPVGQQADPLRSQVEEFLRRTNQGKPARQVAAPARKPAPPAREIELLVDDADARPARRLVGAPLSQRTEPTLGAKPAARPQTATRKRKTLAERADERAAARAQSMAQKVSHLGERIIAEDREFDDQLKAKFDHAVGTLAANTVSETELVPVARETPASRIAAMLANPDGVRQAIVLNEILNRPSDRW